MLNLSNHTHKINCFSHKILWTWDSVLKNLFRGPQEIVRRIAADTAFKERLEVARDSVDEVIRLCHSNFENPLR